EKGVIRKIPPQVLSYFTNQVSNRLEGTIDDRSRCLFDRKVQRIGDLLLDCLACEFAIERLCAAKKKRWIDETRRHERIRESRLVAACSIARRPWEGAHAIGSQSDRRIRTRLRCSNNAASTKRDRAQIRK